MYDPCIFVFLLPLHFCFLAALAFLFFICQICVRRNCLKTRNPLESNECRWFASASASVVNCNKKRRARSPSTADDKFYTPCRTHDLDPRAESRICICATPQGPLNPSPLSRPASFIKPDCGPKLMQSTNNCPVNLSDKVKEQ